MKIEKEIRGKKVREKGICAMEGRKEEKKQRRSTVNRTYERDIGPNVSTIRVKVKGTKVTN